MRASVELSVAGLAAPQRRALRLLGGLPCAEFPVWLAAAAIGRPAAETEIIAERLVDSQLLQAAGVDPAGQARYRFHELIHDYAREQCNHLGPEERLSRPTGP